MTASQSDTDLKMQLRDQLEFLEASSKAFDAGHTSEAKRLAVTIRLLAHDTSESMSLLGLLGLKGGTFIDTALPMVKGNELGHQGLVVVAMKKSGSQYIAPLDIAPGQLRRVPFNEWWERIVFADSTKNQLSRETLVLAMANQDSGAHVDPRLSEFYAKISRQHVLSMQEVRGGKGVPVTGIERAAVRQIAHEMIKTLKPGYSRKPDLSDVLMLAAEPAVFPAADDPKSLFVDQPRALGRNSPCHCGSGKKFKKCHGA